MEDQEVKKEVEMLIRGGGEREAVRHDDNRLLMEREREFTKWQEELDKSTAEAEAQFEEHLSTMRRCLDSTRTGLERVSTDLAEYIAADQCLEAKQRRTDEVIDQGLASARALSSVMQSVHDYYINDSPGHAQARLDLAAIPSSTLDIAREEMVALAAAIDGDDVR